MNLFNTYKGLRKEMYVLFISKMITSMGAMVWSMLTILMTNNLGMSATDISLWMVGFTVIDLPLSFVGGKLADHCNKKILIFTCDFIEVIAYLYCAFVPITKASILVYLIVCSIEHLSGPAYNVMMADLSSSADRERANSLLYFGNNLGMLLTPTISGFLVKDHPNALFLIQGIATLIALIIEIIFLKDISVTVDDSNQYEAPQQGRGLIAVLKDNIPVTLFMVAMGLQWLIYGEWNFLIPLDLNAIYPEKGSVIYGMVSSLNCLTVILFTTAITGLFAKISDTVEYTISIVLFVLGYILFIRYAQYEWMCYLAIFIFSLGEILATLSGDPFITRRIPMTHRGRILSLSGIIGNAVYTLGQLPISNVYDKYGSKAAWNVVIVICFVILAIMILICKIDKKRYPDLYKEKTAEEAV